MAEKRIDILIDDETGNFLVTQGDFAVDDSIVQNLGLIAHANKGEWKQHPLLGPNIQSMLLSKMKASDISREYKLHLQSDGINFSEVSHLINIEVL